MHSLIHLFKLMKNQVLNILLIICIFLEVFFLLIRWLTDTWWLDQDTKVFFCPDFLNKWSLCVHTVRIDFFLLATFEWFDHFQPNWTELKGFQTSYVPKASRKLGGQVGKWDPNYNLLQERLPDELSLFHTENSHQVHAENIDKVLPKETPD